jgi:hypothetical protein
MGDCLLLDNEPAAWTAQKISAASLRQVAAIPGGLRALLANRQFRAVLACQRLERDPRTGTWVLPEKEALDAVYRLEPLAEFRATPLARLRISRVRYEGGAPPPPGLEVRDPMQGLPPESWPAARAAFLDRFLKGLP